MPKNTPELEKLKNRLKRLKPVKGNLTRLAQECAALDPGDVRDEIVNHLFFSPSFEGDSPQLRAEIFFGAGNDHIPETTISSMDFSAVRACLHKISDMERDESRALSPLARSLAERLVHASTPADNPNLFRILEDAASERGYRASPEARRKLVESALSDEGRNNPSIVPAGIVLTAGDSAFLDILENLPRDKYAARAASRALSLDTETSRTLAKSVRRRLVDILFECAPDLEDPNGTVLSTEWKQCVVAACGDLETDEYLLLKAAREASLLPSDISEVFAAATSPISPDGERAFLLAADAICASLRDKNVRYWNNEKKVSVNAVSRWRFEPAAARIAKGVFEQFDEGKKERKEGLYPGFHAIDEERLALVASAHIRTAVLLGAASDPRGTFLPESLERVRCPRYASTLERRTYRSSYSSSRTPKRHDEASRMLGEAYAAATGETKRDILHAFLEMLANIRTESNYHMEKGLAAMVEEWFGGGGTFDPVGLASVPTDILDANLASKLFIACADIAEHAADKRSAREGAVTALSAFVSAASLKSGAEDDETGSVRISLLNMLNRIDKTNYSTNEHEAEALRALSNVLSEEGEGETHASKRPLFDMLSEAASYNDIFARLVLSAGVELAALQEELENDAEKTGKPVFEHGFFSPWFESSLSSESSETATALFPVMKKYNDSHPVFENAFGAPMETLEKRAVRRMTELPFSKDAYGRVSEYFKHRMTESFWLKNTEAPVESFFENRVLPLLRETAFAALQTGDALSFCAAAQAFFASQSAPPLLSRGRFLRETAAEVVRADERFGFDGDGILDFILSMGGIVRWDNANPEASVPVLSALLENLPDVEKRTRALSAEWAKYLFESPEIHSFFLKTASELHALADEDPEGKDSNRILGTLRTAVEWSCVEASATAAAELLVYVSVLARKQRAVDSEDVFGFVFRTGPYAHIGRGYAASEAVSEALSRAEKRNIVLHPDVCARLAMFVDTDDSGDAGTVLLRMMRRNCDEGQPLFDAKTNAGRETHEALFETFSRILASDPSPEFEQELLRFITDDNVRKALFRNTKVHAITLGREKFLEAFAPAAAAMSVSDMSEDDSADEVVL